MELTENQYERIARRFDGENVTLSAAEKAAYDEIAAGEAQVAAVLTVPAELGDNCAERTDILARIGIAEHLLGNALDADVPPQAVASAWRRMRVALARPQRMLLRVGALAAGIAIAAGAVLTLTLVSPRPAATVAAAPPTEATVAAAPPTEAYVESVSAVQDPAINLLAEEIDQLESDLLASAPPTPLDLGLDQLERDLETFWLDDVTVE